MPESPTIYERYSNLCNAIDALQKNKKGFGYTYVTEDAILASVTANMKKFKLLLIPIIVPGTLQVVPYTYDKTKILSDGTVLSEKVNELLCTADMEYHWINPDDPEDRIIVPWSLVASQSDASFSFGGALTYSKRQFLLKTLHCATTDDDPDSYRAKQKEAELAAQREVTAAILETIGATIADHLESQPDDRDSVINTIKKHVKVNGRASGDYNKITDPKTAAELLSALRRQFGIEESTTDNTTEKEE